MRKRIFALCLATVLVGSTALAEEQEGRRDSTEVRLERIEQALARLERKVSAPADSAMMMQGCPMMQGMMGGSADGKSRLPNEQWKDDGRR